MSQGGVYGETGVQEDLRSGWDRLPQGGWRRMQWKERTSIYQGPSSFPWESQGTMKKIFLSGPLSDSRLSLVAEFRDHLPRQQRPRVLEVPSLSLGHLCPLFLCLLCAGLKSRCV